LNKEESSFLETCLSKAEDCLSRESWEEAEKHVRLAYREDPNNPRVLELQKILKQIWNKQDDFSYLVHSARSHFLETKYEQSLKYWEQALEMYPDNDEALHGVKQCRNKIEIQNRIDCLKMEVEESYKDANYKRTFIILNELEELDVEENFIAELRQKTIQQESWKRRINGIVSEGKEAHKRGDLLKALNLIEKAGEMDEQDTEIQTIMSTIHKEMVQQNQELSFLKKFRFIEQL